MHALVGITLNVKLCFGKICDVVVCAIFVGATVKLQVVYFLPRRLFLTHFPFTSSV